MIFYDFIPFINVIPDDRCDSNQTGETLIKVFVGNLLEVRVHILLRHLLTFCSSSVRRINFSSDEISILVAEVVSVLIKLDRSVVTDL